MAKVEGSEMAFPNLQAEMSRYEVDEEAIASAAQRSVKTIQNWFKGKGEPSYTQAQAIRDECFPSMPIEYLFSTQPLDLAKVS